ncbi:MAG: hypothetical protein KAW12_01555 [Candidatus Aminicenantes bacterium]|nr:hypothetical protein [Candidatus Aminicenantes bacterium]
MKTKLIFGICLLSFFLLVFLQADRKDEELNLEELQLQILNQGYNYTVGETGVSHIPIEQLCGLRVPKDWQRDARFDGQVIPDDLSIGLPLTFDWRNYGHVTSVKNQGGCGSCWAFATLGAYEAAISVNFNKTEDLSEQFLVDCNTLDWGCNGGWFAFSNMRNGVPKESCYPYVAYEQSCRVGCTKYYPLNTWYYVGKSYSVPTVNSIKNAIYQNGPVAAAVYVNNSFRWYSGGVYNSTASGPVNHAVLLVGWDDPGGYFIMKNSWGTGWGEKGYMRIAYGCQSVGHAACYGIPSDITVTTPNGGETWRRGSIRNITWNSTNLSNNIKITLWKNDSFIGTIIKGIDPSPGFYHWTVGKLNDGSITPNGQDYKIKIKEVNSSAADFSDAKFAIASIKVTAPNGGENWKIGSAHDITWVSRALAKYIKIILLKDGAYVCTIANDLDPAGGSYPWTVGQCIGVGAEAGTGYKIKIKGKSTNVSDESNVPFTISPPPPPSIEITSPNGGESWKTGSTHDITWNTTGVSRDVKITLRKDGSLVGVIAPIISPGAGSYHWKVGEYYINNILHTAPPGSGYTIKIKQRNAAVVDSSDAPFEISHGTTGASWTFMIYLDADNNLESAGIDDFLEMAAVGSTANVNIVVQFDRIAGYDTSYGDWTGTKRFYITPGLTPDAANAEQDLGEANMGDPAALVDFVNWSKTNYPASNYALSIWNHGDGWRGRSEAKPIKTVCWDDTDGDALYTAEVRAALTSCGGAQLIGFDACLMGMLEVAYEIKDYGQVMVGSEESEPGDGWPYNTIMADLTANPTWTASQLGSAIVDRYYASYGNGYTQSALDLTNLSTLASTVSTFAQSMRDNWNTDEAAVRSAAHDVMTQVNNTLINEKHGTAWPGAHGLAIYFPRIAGSFDPDYNGSIIKFAKDFQWDEFLQAYYGSMTGSWLVSARGDSQEFYYPEYIDLYHFCELLTITPASITVTSPNGGENWQIDSTQNITWTHFGLSNKTIEIVLLKDGLAEGIIAENLYASSSPYNWTVGEYYINNILYTASPGTNYELEIKEKDTNVSDKSDAPFTIFQTGPPGAPVLISPINDVVVNTLTPLLKWNAVTADPPVTEYRIQVREMDESVIFDDDVGNNHEFRLPGGVLTNNTRYKWLAMAKSSYGDSAWSQHEYFWTQCAPGAPVLISPINDVVVNTLTPLLKWNAVTADPPVTKYRIQVREMDESVIFDDDIETLTEFRLPGGVLTNNTRYKWLAMAKSSYGDSAWSQHGYFWTQCAPGTPVPISPKDNEFVSTLTPLLKWDAAVSVLPVTDYEVRVNAGNNEIIVPPTQVGNVLQYLLPVQLECNRTYKWEVRAKNGCDWGSWSDWTFFRAPMTPQKPTIIYPKDGVQTGLTPTLQWEAVNVNPAVDKYHIEVYRVDTGGKVINLEVTGTGYKIPAGELLWGTSYRWHVRAHNNNPAACNDWGSWSVYGDFSTIICNIPAAPVLISPINDVVVGTLTPVFKWTPVTADPPVTKYRIQVRTMYETVIFDQDVGNITEFQLPGGVLTTNTRYKWLVMTKSSCGDSAWSQNGYFWTPGPPGAPAPVSPINCGFTNDLTPVFRWNPPNSTLPVINYRLQVIDSSGAFKFNREVGNVTVYEIPDSGLQFNQEYQWRVIAQNSWAWGTWSDYACFKAPETPYAPNIIYPKGGTYTDRTPGLEWEAVNVTPPVDKYHIKVYIHDTNEKVIDVEASGTSYQVPDDQKLPAGTRFRWEVRAHNIKSWGPWSAQKVFYTY